MKIIKARISSTVVYVEFDSIPSTLKVGDTISPISTEYPFIVSDINENVPIQKKGVSVQFLKLNWKDNALIIPSHFNQGVEWGILLDEYDCTAALVGHNYKPLPYYLTIKQSTIEGLGLFADRDIPDKYHMGISHIIMPEPLRYVENDFPNDLIRTPLGGFINHCEDANCILDKGVDYLFLISNRKIEKGEEITLNYHNEICGFKK